MAASDTNSLRSTTDGGKKVAFRPTLVIPPPGTNFTPPYSARTVSSGGKTPRNKFARKGSVFVYESFKSGVGFGEKGVYWLYRKLRAYSKKWLTHCFLSIVILIYTIGGALVFVTIEGQNEIKVIEKDIRKDMINLLKDLRNMSIVIPHLKSELEWQGAASRRINVFEQKVKEAYVQHPLVVLNLVADNEGQEPIWTMYNAVVYCTTLYTTIGFGHLYPTTLTGRTVTLAYSIIGIPLFLLALTDFGKLFTRGIKFLWSFVRRLYYTGSCRKVRKTAHVEDIFKGAQIALEVATFRRPSFMVDSEEPSEGDQSQKVETVTVETATATVLETPTTPAISNFEIDDEFNLPVTVALSILVAYILCGSVVYMYWEDWDFFVSFYFVFISMSTIGFGDFVPTNKICMIISLVYLCFGLALMSMCINVVQDKLSDTFTHASAKIGATIGLEVEEDGSVTAVSPEKVEIADIHEPVEDDGLTIPSTPGSKVSFKEFRFSNLDIPRCFGKEKEQDESPIFTIVD